MLRSVNVLDYVSVAVSDMEPIAGVLPGLVWASDGPLRCVLRGKGVG